jgi:hypothetical protein
MQLRRVPIALTNGWGGLSRMSAPVARLAMGAPPSTAGEFADLGTQAPGAIGFVRRQFASLKRPRLLLPALSRVQESARTPLDRLVALQRADGSWELTSELAAVLGTTRSRLQAASPQTATSRGWATALAIAWLREHAIDRQNEWELLARKAIKWLDDHAGTVEGPELLVAATKLYRTTVAL